MSLVSRAQNIIVRPAAEWPVIAIEPISPATLYTGYIIPLAAIGPVCAFLSSVVFTHRPVFGVIVAVLSFVLELIYVFVAAVIAQSLAPSFGGIADRLAALKWIAYAYTPRWVAGIFNLIPILGPLLVLVSSLYSLYVLYLGTVPMMRVPQEKAIGYVVVTIVCIIVIGIVLGVVIGLITAASMFASPASYTTN